MKRSGWIGERFWKYGRSRKICLWFRHEGNGKKQMTSGSPVFDLSIHDCGCVIYWEERPGFGRAKKGDRSSFVIPVSVDDTSVIALEHKQFSLSPLHLSSPSHHLLPRQLQWPFNWSLSFCFCPLPVHSPQSSQRNLCKTKSDHVSLLPKSFSVFPSTWNKI